MRRKAGAGELGDGGRGEKLCGFTCSGDTASDSLLAQRVRAPWKGWLGLSEGTGP